MKDLRIFVVAGEPSGDAIGGRLMASLKAQYPGTISFDGIGGPQMAAQGLVSRFAYTELAVMGLVEVLPKARALMARMRQLARLVDSTRPDALVTIDAPAFAFGLVRRLRQRDVRRIHYVAPTVWAWRPRRVHKFKRYFDHLLALFPFEPRYFTDVGLACTFVGHPLAEETAPGMDRAACRGVLGIADGGPVLGVLPGSRVGEINRLAGPFGETVRRVAATAGPLTVVVVTLPHLAARVRAATGGWAGTDVTVVIEDQRRFVAMAACDAALAASGTVTLELARLRVPVVLAYRVAPITAWLVRRMMRVKYVSLVNLLVDDPVVPEFLQENCVAARMAPAVAELLGDGAARDAVLAGQDAAVAMLAPRSTTPSAKAAAVVLDEIRRR